MVVVVWLLGRARMAVIERHRLVIGPHLDGGDEELQTSSERLASVWQEEDGHSATIVDGGNCGAQKAVDIEG